jgi:2'-5' RNA ligase
VNEVSKPAGTEKRVRMFVALDLPQPAREGIATWGGESLADPALRPVLPESLHVTLAFLGSRPLAQVVELEPIIEALAGPAPTLELLDPVARPLRGRPGLFALPARSPGAELLQAGLQEQLVAAGLYEPEKRPFWPHVTIARVRPEGRGSRRPQTVAKVPGKLPAGLRKPWFCRRVTLYRSELQPSGARYVPLAQVELSQTDGS